MSPLCLLRFVLRNRLLLAPRPWISGHDMEEQPTERGQPECVQVMKCMACGMLDVTWGPCAKCGHR